MIAIKTLDKGPFHEINRKYSQKLIFDSDPCVYYYGFYNNDKMIGYSKIKVLWEKGKVILEDFYLEDVFPLTTFFLKATGLKVYNLGFDRLYNQSDFLGDWEKIIVLEELFSLSI